MTRLAAAGGYEDDVALVVYHHPAPLDVSFSAASEAVTPQTEDAAAHAQDLQRERCVLFVACTRARDHLYVSGTGEPSPFLPSSPERT